MKYLVESGAEEDYVRLYQGVYMKEMEELQGKWGICDEAKERMKKMQGGMTIDKERVMEGDMKCLVEDVISHCEQVIGKEKTKKCLHALKIVERGLSVRELRTLV